MRSALLVLSLALGGCSLEQSGLAEDAGDRRDVGVPDVGPRDGAGEDAAGDDGGEDAGEDAAGIDAAPMDGCIPTSPPSEACDGIDNDCDPLTADGSGDPFVGMACDGEDEDLCTDGTRRCSGGGLLCDDDPVATLEACNNVDDDCDVSIDEGITRSCSTACGMGTETCAAGAYVGCTAPMPVDEVCNNEDDNCNGLRDEGVTRPCTSACGTGTEICMAGVFGACSVPPPSAEACSPRRDEDCDGTIDEGTVCGCSRRTFGGRIYQFCDLPVVWLSAVMYCSMRGYTLVTVNDASEDGFLDTEWPTVADDDWWIGLNDRAAEGIFGWVGGSAATFRDWAAGQPNDYFGQDCTAIDNGDFGEEAGRWNDHDCDDVRPFICEGP